MFICNFILKLSISHCQQIKFKKLSLALQCFPHLTWNVFPSHLHSNQNPIHMDQLKANIATDFSLVTPSIPVRSKHLLLLRLYYILFLSHDI